MTPTRVLLAEDEESFIDALTIGLRREGFHIEVARDGIEAMGLFDQGRYDLVLLDIMLPGVSGIDVCRHIRARSTVPIIMVTARSTEIDTVVGLEVGADDYVTKPYRLRELVARMRAVLRRSPTGEPTGAGTPTEAKGRDQDSVLSVSGVLLDPDRHYVTVRDRQISLPLKQFDLLKLLMANAGRVLTRDLLIDRVWGADYVGDTKTLDVHIKRLRAQLEVDPARPSLITTIRGLGYRFEKIASPRSTSVPAT
jgi:two-component system response regulator RegX3